MAIPSRSSEKEAQRQSARATLHGMSAEQASDWSSQIATGISVWFDQHPEASRIATFAALQGEPDLSSLFDLQHRRELLYPLVHSDFSLTFHLVSDIATLKSGRFGILEPNPQVHPPVLLSEADAILCPGLAFGEDGTRLGRGKGFYDRALAEASPRATRIGVCFPNQIHATLPSEAHDAVMTHLANVSGVRLITDRPGGVA